MPTEQIRQEVFVGRGGGSHFANKFPPCKSAFHEYKLLATVPFGNIHQLDIFRPPPLGTEGIIFWGCPSIHPSIHLTVHP